MVGEIEDNQAGDNAEHGGVGVAIAKEPFVEPVEHVPSTSPHQDESEHDRYIACKIAWV